jgi:hypothetical protein
LQCCKVNDKHINDDDDADVDDENMVGFRDSTTCTYMNSHFGSVRSLDYERQDLPTPMPRKARLE